MDTNSTFSAYITQYAVLNGISTAEMAKGMGYSYNTVRKWIKGICVPGCLKTKELADYFGISVEELALIIVNKNDHSYLLSYLLDCIHYALCMPMYELCTAVGTSETAYFGWKNLNCHPTNETINSVSKAFSWDPESVNLWCSRSIPSVIKVDVIQGACKSFHNMQKRKM